MYRIGIECESIEEGEQWGVGRIVSKLIEEIAKRPELVDEFRFYLYFKSRIPDNIHLASPIFIKKIVKIPFARPSFSLYYYVFLPIKLYFEKLDVMFYPNYMLPLIHKGKSIVTLTGDIYYEIRNKNLPFRYRLAYKIFAEHAARHATAITSVSETAAKEVSELFKIPKERVFATPLGVDTDKLQKTTNHKPQTTNYLLFVGQAFPRRHLRETIIAVDELVNDFPELKLVAVGKDKYQLPIIEELAYKINKKHGKEVIIYKDYVPEKELLALYQNANSFIYVSPHEAFGLPPLEALAAGTVPIVADTKLNDEIYGENAFKVSEPISISGIAKAIKESLTNQQKRQQILNAAPKILEKYTWKEHTSLFLEIIRKVTETKNSNSKF